MANRRIVKSSRAVYTRRPGRAPSKPTLRPSGESVKRGVQGGVIVLAMFGVWRFFSIGNIEVKGNSVVPAAEIAAEVSSSFSRHHFSKNLLTLGLAPLPDDLLKDQRIGSVSVERRWPNKIVVVIVERSLSIVWVSAGRSYLLDNNGVAVGQLDRSPKGLPVITDSTGLPVRVGERIVSQHFVQFSGVIASGLTSQTKLIATIVSVPDTTTELDIKTTAGYTIKFDTGSGAEDQLSSLKTVLVTLARLKKTPTQYIDLRVPGKAYYL